MKCVKSQELEIFFRSLLKEGVGVPSDEEFLKSEEGRKKFGSMGVKGKSDLRNILTREKLKDCIEGGKTHINKRAKLRSDIKELLSNRQFKTSLGKVKKHCQSVKSKL